MGAKVSSFDATAAMGPGNGVLPAESQPLRRWAELVVLFGLVPVALAVAPRMPLVLPAILASGLLCLVLLLRDPTFDRRLLWAGPGPTPLRAVLVRTGLLCMVLAAVLALWKPDVLFALPRSRPGVWLVILLLYPPLSVYPQELVFRTFFQHRYGRLLRTPVARIAASGVAFGHAHVILHNPIIVGLTVVGGLLFAATYERSRSLWLVSLEHALYGCWLLTLGLGGLFHSALRLAGAG